MSKRKTSSKQIIKCPFCDNDYVKKYISMHIRRIHKSNEYCTIIRRGMTYKNLSQTNIVNQEGELFFCQLCNKSIKKRSKYNHFSSETHKYWSNIIKQKNEQNEVKDIKVQNVIESSKNSQPSKKDISDIDAKFNKISVGLIPKFFISNNNNDTHFGNESFHINDDLENKSDENCSDFNEGDSSSSSYSFNGPNISRDSIFDSCYDSWKIRKEVDRIIENIEKKKRKNKI